MSAHPMVVLPSSGGYRPNKGIKREHDPDQAHDVNSKSPKANGTPDNHAHQHKRKKGHHHQNQNEGGKKRKKSKHKAPQSQQQEDTLMSGDLGDMSAELGEPILPPPRNPQHSTPEMPKAMKVKHAKTNEDEGSGKKKKSKTKTKKTVHFEEPGSNYHPPHVDDVEEAETEGFEMNGDSAQHETSTLLVRSHSPILPPTSSPILPPTRPRSSSSHGPPPPILPQASPSCMNPLYVPPTNSTPILPPASPFRKRRGSTGNAFSQKPPTFSTEALRPQATQPAPAKLAATKSAELKPKDDEWEFSTGKIRAMIGDPMEKDAQREENIAFSSNYIQSPMRQAQGINVGGVNFSIWHIKTRETFNFRGKSNGLQVCSVTQGSIWVFLGLKKFRISKGGMWRIREGEICSVKNQDGHECVLHITSIPNTSALSVHQ